MDWNMPMNDMQTQIEHSEGHREIPTSFRGARGFVSDMFSMDELDERPQLTRVDSSMALRRGSTRSSLGSNHRRESTSSSSMLFYCDEIKRLSEDLRLARRRSSCCSKSRSINSDSKGSFQILHRTESSKAFDLPSEIEIQSNRRERRISRRNSQRSMDSTSRGLHSSAHERKISRWDSQRSMDSTDSYLTIDSRTPTSNAYWPTIDCHDTRALGQSSSSQQRLEPQADDQSGGIS